MQAWLAALAGRLTNGGRTQAAGAVWNTRRVPVWDFAPDDWKPNVARAVADFNAAMPPGVPRLVYRAMGEQACDSLPEYGRKGGISVCVGADANWAHTYAVGREMRRAKILLHPDGREAVRAKALCHELMHAVTYAPEGYTLDENGRPVGLRHERTSCVQGLLTTPGPWDRAFARKMYRGRNLHP